MWFQFSLLYFLLTDSATDDILCTHTHTHNLKITFSDELSKDIFIIDEYHKMLPCLFGLDCLRRHLLFFQIHTLNQMSRGLQILVLLHLAILRNLWKSKEGREKTTATKKDKIVENRLLWQMQLKCIQKQFVNILFVWV